MDLFSDPEVWDEIRLLAEDEPTPDEVRILELEGRILADRWDQLRAARTLRATGRIYAPVVLLEGLVRS